MRNALLQVSQLSVAVRSRTGLLTKVVDDFSITVEPGQVAGLAGESGSGKTVSMMALLHLLPAGAVVHGEARFLGHSILNGASDSARPGRDIGLVMQDPYSSLHPMLTIGRQLTDHVRYHLHLNSKEAQARALDLLREVHIPDPEGSYGAYPHQFSGGMRQRIAIATALACKPALLIADEPTTGLDVTVQAGILRVLHDLAARHELGIVLITHDLGVLASIADTVTVMYAGRIVEAGSSAQVLGFPRHPYTAALLRALPHPSRPDVPLAPIPGRAVPASLRPAGCAFAPRCTYSEDRCHSITPPLVGEPSGHAWACYVDPLGRS